MSPKETATLAEAAETAKQLSRFVRLAFLYYDPYHSDYQLYPAFCRAFFLRRSSPLSCDLSILYPLLCLHTFCGTDRKAAFFQLRAELQTSYL